MIASRIFQRRELQDPPAARFIFANTIMAPLWLIARLYLGYQWLLAGWHKVYGDERWIAVEGEDGLALKSFWERIVQVPEEGRPPIVYDWYRDFIQYMLDNEWYTWMAWVISLGEVAVGLALIVGLFTGLAALGGATMNFNFMLAGSASTNPVMFLVAVLVLLGWKVAGWIGLDRWVLPALGTPWQPGPAVTEMVEHTPGGMHSRPAT
jgi:thiosulfate dehydrogenase [quinone] large subunit